MIFGPILFIAFIAAIAYFTLRGRPTRGETAREILERRYAAGEINKEQFDQMKRDLS